MATQITHIVHAEKLRERFFPQVNRDEFLIGTVFPDIRYLGGISREQTHAFSGDWEGVLAQTSSFEAGRQLHCLIDLARETYLTEEGLYEILPEMPDRYSVPKFVEDVLLYDDVQDWPSIVAGFKKALSEEIDFGAPLEHIQRWHANLQQYFSSPPSNVSRMAHGRGLGFSDERIATLNANIADILARDDICTILVGFYENLETAVTSWAE